MTMDREHLRSIILAYRTIGGREGADCCEDILKGT